jgi:hypothetical protein
MGRTRLIEYVSALPVTMHPYHAEFGYLCPSPGVRRNVRLALISGSVGMLFGAIGVVALLDKRPAQASAPDQASAFARTDLNERNPDTYPVLVNSNGLLSNDVILPLPEDCRPSARSFFDRSCRFVRKHGLRGARSTAHSASAGIGRSDPVEGAVAHQLAAIDVSPNRPMVTRTRR